MAYHSGEKLLLAAMASFLGGAILGMMLGKENRDWVSENAGELGERLNEITQEARKLTKERYQNVDKNIKDKAPDLIQATKDALKRGR
ncbi:MAG: hypothetical protein WD491_05940 [Balneolales bacterium]